MSPTYLNHFPVKDVSFIINTFPLSLLILGFMVEFFLLLIALHNWVIRIYESFSRSRFLIQSQLDSNAQSEKKNQDLEKKNQVASCPGNKMDDGNLSAEDVEMVMRRFGIFCHPEDGKLQERFNSDHFSNLFEEEEPSLDEVKAAFDVYDENRDGFIDERELQRVLCVLGFKKGTEIDSCRNMIRAFDKNGDGRIDFREFVKFMENSF